MIIFKDVSAKNFLSIGKMGIKYNLDSNDVTLIHGKNGVGKSNIIDMIHYALFGKPFRKIKLNQLINTLNNKGLYVTIEFSIDGIDYKINRGMKPNIFEIYRDDQRIPVPASKADYQNILESTILQFNSKTFNQVVIIGSSSFTPFMQLTSADRRLVIEDLLDLKVFGLMSDVIKSRISHNKSELLSLQTDINLIEQEIEIKELNNLRISDNTDTNIKTITGLIEANSLERDTIHQDITICNEAISSIEVGDAISCNNDISRLNVYMTSFNNKLNKADNDISFYTENDTCPTCTQGIDTKVKSDRIDHLDNTKNKLNSGILKAGNKLNELTNRLAIMNNSTKRLSKLESELSDLSNNMKTVLLKLSDLDIELINANKDRSLSLEDLSNIHNRLTALQSNYSDIFNKQIVLGDVNNLLKDDGIKANIVSFYSPILNQIITDNLKVLDFQCKFEFNQEFNEVIKSRGRDKFSYESFSAGEKLRIDLSLLFAFREIAAKKNSLATNLLILDEFTRGTLDDEGIAGAMILIKNCSVDTFIISHEDDVMESSLITKSIELVKTGNFTAKKE